MDKFFTVLVLLGLIVGSIGLIGLIAALLAKKTPAKKMPGKTEHHSETK